VTTSQRTKILGTILAGAVVAALPLIPPPYHDMAVSTVTMILGWLHIPRPGDVKAAS
jgi:hypothetical protein